MNRDRILNVVLLLVGLAVSFFLAGSGDAFYDHYGVPTPGVLAARAFVHPLPPPNQLANLGRGIMMQFVVDWIFWFAVMWLIYFLVVRLGRKSRTEHR